MARRGEAVWQTPHNEPQRRKCPLGPPKGAPAAGGLWNSRRALGCLTMPTTPSQPANSGALGERDLFRGCLGLEAFPGFFARRGPLGLAVDVRGTPSNLIEFVSLAPQAGWGQATIH